MQKIDSSTFSSMKGIKMTFEELLSLTDVEFAETYLKQMGKYDYFEDGKKPDCTRCHKPIDSFEEMRKYCGQVLHPDCLRKTYREDDKSFMSEEQKKVLERILSMKL